MKTVLIAIPCLKTGGTEIQTLRLVEALVAGDYRVVTVCYFEYDSFMVQQFKTAGSLVECMSVDGTRPNGIIPQVTFLYKGLRRIVKQCKPNIAHVQYMAPGALPILILRGLGVKTFVSTAHTMADIYKNLHLVHILQRHILRVFTCITETAEKSFFGNSHPYTLDTILKQHNHYTIYNTLAPNYQIIERAGALSSSTDITIGFVGRLVSIKGADLVIPAFAKLRMKYPSAKLMIVGDGVLRATMQQQALEYHVEQYIVWKGLQPYDTLPELYQQMDFVWIPSRSEGFGLTAVEAMANGCIVLASNTGGLPEILQNPINLFQTENTADMADKTFALLKDTCQLSVIRTQLTQRARDFQFDNYQSQILSLYSKLQ